MIQSSSSFWPPCFDLPVLIVHVSFMYIWVYLDDLLGWVMSDKW